MKSIITLCLLGIGIHLNAQVGIGTIEPHTSSVLDVESENKGFLPPRMSTEERNDINGGVFAEGLIIYNTDIHCLEFYNNSTWFNFCGSTGSVLPPPPGGIDAIPLGDASLGTTYCFDIGESNDLINGAGSLTQRAYRRADFNETATNTKTLTFKSTTPVSNLTFYAVDETGKVIESFTPAADYSANGSLTEATAEIVYKSSLSSPDPDNPTTADALGKFPSNALKATYYAVYHDQENGGGTEVKLKFEPNIRDSQCGGFSQATGIGFNLMMADNGHAYGLGYNISGHVGLGYVHQFSDNGGYEKTLTKVDIDNQLVGFSQGFFHSMFLDVEGKVYVNSYNANINASEVGTGKPLYVPMPNGQSVTYIHANWDGCFAVTTDGTIYGWGNEVLLNEQLGIDYVTGSPTFTTTPIEIVIPNGLNISEIGARRGATFLLADDGMVYSAGTGIIGRTVTPSAPSHEFHPLSFPGSAGNIIDIATGGDAHFAVDENNNLYTWGNNTYGSCGINSVVAATTPVQVTKPTGMGTIVDIYSGSRSAVILDANNDLWAAGRNIAGELGTGYITPFRDEFEKCILPAGVIPVDVHPGAYFTMILGNDGQYYSAGRLVASNAVRATSTESYRVVGVNPAQQFHLIENVSVLNSPLTFIAN